MAEALAPHPGGPVLALLGQPHALPGVQHSLSHVQCHWNAVWLASGWDLLTHYLAWEPGKGDSAQPFSSCVAKLCHWSAKIWPAVQSCPSSWQVPGCVADVWLLLVLGLFLGCRIRTGGWG